MQTNETALLRAMFDGLVQGPVRILVDLVKAGHLEAASLVAEGVSVKMEEFSIQLKRHSTPVEVPAP